jgi:hypothetical protein
VGSIASKFIPVFAQGLVPSFIFQHEQFIQKTGNSYSDNIVHYVLYYANNIVLHGRAYGKHIFFAFWDGSFIISEHTCSIDNNIHIVSESIQKICENADCRLIRISGTIFSVMSLIVRKM